MTAPMTRADVDRIVSEDRANATTPDLRGANLRGADLRGANLRGADLWDANLQYANLQYANLWDANLQYANLQYANLQYANLRGTSGASGVAMGVSGLPSGTSTLYPTPDGWRLTVGCWQGTPDTLRTMIASDYGWPEATGAECARRRPSLQALLALCEDHIARHPDTITDLAAKWAPEVAP